MTDFVSHPFHAWSRMRGSTRLSGCGWNAAEFPVPDGVAPDGVDAPTGFVRECRRVSSFLRRIGLRVPGNGAREAGNGILG